MSGLEEWPSCRSAGRQNSAYRPSCQQIPRFFASLRITGWRGVMAALSAGSNAPDFTLSTLEGKPLALADSLKRGPAVLAFFKVSCPVCQYAFPFLERLYQGYRNNQIAVIGVSQNSKRDTVAFRKQYGITFPIVLDDPSNYRVSNAYGLTNVPSIFLLFPSGAIEVSSVGWSRAEIAEMNTKLAGAISTLPAPVFQPGQEVAEWKPG